MTDSLESRDGEMARPALMPIGSADALQALAMGDEGLIGAMAAAFADGGPASLARHAPVAESDGGDGGGPQPDPLASMRRAFRAQMTDALFQKAVNASDNEVARMLGQKLTTVIDGEDLAQAVLTKTWMGTLHWKHDVVSLLQHVCDCVRSATFRLHASRRQVSLDELLDTPSQEAETERTLGQVCAHAGVDPLRDVALRRIAAAVEEALWNMATVLADPDVLDGLAAVLQGAHGEVEIAEVTGMELRQARRAWRRLRQWFDDLPAGLRDQARELL